MNDCVYVMLMHNLKLSGREELKKKMYLSYGLETLYLGDEGLLMRNLAIFIRRKIGSTFFIMLTPCFYNGKNGSFLFY